ncbi:MAG: diacylglycerol kinase family lipid kinase [Desulfomonilaceae bacterium]|nr:diacylglycerol kinase family lipid kinase [Desulfomonilaceae bacterium]
MDILIIGNPAAGRGRARERTFKFQQALERRGHVVETFLTERRGDAGSRASRIDSAVDRLVIAGGDGTVNEVLNGLQDPSEIPLFHLPTGTANMLAWDLNLPNSTQGLVGVLEEGAVRRLDMGLINGRRFLLVVGAGFDAAVTKEIRNRGRTKLGYRGYVRPVLRAFRRYRPVEMEVIVDEQHCLTGRHVMVLNVRHYGGLFVFWNSARPDSETFDVCVFRSESRVALVRYGLAGLLRLVGKLPDVTHITGRRVRIRSSESIPVQVDGDYFGETPQVVELVPSAVPVIVHARSV